VVIWTTLAYITAVITEMGTDSAVIPRERSWVSWYYVFSDDCQFPYNAVCRT